MWLHVIPAGYGRFKEVGSIAVTLPGDFDLLGAGRRYIESVHIFQFFLTQTCVTLICHHFTTLAQSVKRFSEKE